eukprot:TRINITY_DN3077_c0_g1_i1.p1 TRINITY_DN3077_c0_g1~~TRINITY_DN3077_c0_g1_i1.p1  ORF type:complete len:342 (+),score=82.29 TRINITY_DN3077_c0_g1_i1:81-1106(+)
MRRRFDNRGPVFYKMKCFFALLFLGLLSFTTVRFLTDTSNEDGPRKTSNPLHFSPPDLNSNLGIDLNFKPNTNANTNPNNNIDLQPHINPDPNTDPNPSIDLIPHIDINPNVKGTENRDELVIKELINLRMKERIDARNKDNERLIEKVQHENTRKEQTNPNPDVSNPEDNKNKEIEIPTRILVDKAVVTALLPQEDPLRLLTSTPNLEINCTSEEWNIEAESVPELSFSELPTKRMKNGPAWPSSHKCDMSIFKFGYSNERVERFIINQLMLCNATFVEIESRGGLRSGTYAQEQSLGWKGLCIDPGPLSCVSGSYVGHDPGGGDGGGYGGDGSGKGTKW